MSSVPFGLMHGGRRACAIQPLALDQPKQDHGSIQVAATMRFRHERREPAPSLRQRSCALVRDDRDDAVREMTEGGDSTSKVRYSDAVRALRVAIDVPLGGIANYTRDAHWPAAAMAELELSTDALPILIDGGGRLPHSLPVGGLPFLVRPGLAGGDGHAFEAVNPNVTLRDDAIRHGLDGGSQVARLVGLVLQARCELHLRPTRLSA
jgi:hypothetical protein